MHLKVLRGINEVWWEDCCKYRFSPSSEEFSAGKNQVSSFIQVSHHLMIFLGRDWKRLVPYKPDPLGCTER